METVKTINNANGQFIEIPEYMVYSIGYPVACENLESACEYAREQSEKGYNKSTRFYVVSTMNQHTICYFQKGKHHALQARSLRQPDIERRAKKADK